MNLDSFIQEMVRMSAGALVLNSDRKGLLHLPSGNKFTKVPISHQQLTNMLLEAAPEQYRPGIRKGQAPPVFRHYYDDEPFVIRADSNGGTWSIKVTRERALDGRARVGGVGTRGADPAAGTGGGGGRPEHAVYWSGKVEPPWGARAGGENLAAKEAPRPVSKPGLAPRAAAGEAEGRQAFINPVVAMPVGTPPRLGASEPEPVSPKPPETAQPAPAVSRKQAPPSPIVGTSDDLAALAADPQEFSAPGPVTSLRAEPGARPGQPPRIDRILRKLVAVGGSDLHVTAGQIPRCRVGGNIVPLPDEGPISAEELKVMLFEIMPSRIQEEFTKTKDGDFAHSIEGVARFRVNVGVDHHGIFSVARVIPNEILKPEQIGLPKKVLDLCFLSKGMVLVTGPTGSGKSTTLATLIDVINSNREDHIITIEDPIEFVHPDTKKCLVHQREVGEHTSSFKRALKAALREDPDIVLVGEMRDLETIAIALETASTGHLVFGTLHTSTAPSTVDRIIDQFPANQQEQIRVMLSDSLKGVIAQTLCKRIDGGRVAAFEILICNRAVANLIREGKTFQLYSTMQTTKASGSITLNESLLTLVKKQIISPEEAYIKAVNKDELKDAMAKLGIRPSLQTIDDY